MELVDLPRFNSDSEESEIYENTNPNSILPKLDYEYARTFDSKANATAFVRSENGISDLLNPYQMVAAEFITTVKWKERAMSPLSAPGRDISTVHVSYS